MLRISKTSKTIEEVLIMLKNGHLNEEKFNELFIKLNTLNELRKYNNTATRETISTVSDLVYMIKAQYEWWFSGDTDSKKLINSLKGFYKNMDKYDFLMLTGILPTWQEKYKAENLYSILLMETDTWDCLNSLLLSGLSVYGAYFENHPVDKTINKEIALRNFKYDLLSMIGEL